MIATDLWSLVGGSVGKVLLFLPLVAGWVWLKRWDDRRKERGRALGEQHGQETEQQLGAPARLKGKLEREQRARVNAGALWIGVVVFGLLVLAYSVWSENRSNGQAMTVTTVLTCAFLACLIVYAQTVEEDAATEEQQFREAIRTRDLAALSWFVMRMRRRGALPHQIATEATRVAEMELATWDSIVEEIDSAEVLADCPHTGWWATRSRESRAWLFLSFSWLILGAAGVIVFDPADYYSYSSQYGFRLKMDGSEVLQVSTLLVLPLLAWLTRRLYVRFVGSPSTARESQVD